MESGLGIMVRASDTGLGLWSELGVRAMGQDQIGVRARSVDYRLR